MVETARSKARTAFLDEGEIDEFMIHVIPKFVGEGIGIALDVATQLSLAQKSRRFGDGGDRNETC